MIDDITQSLLDSAKRITAGGSETSNALFQLQIGTVASLVACRRLLDEDNGNVDKLDSAMLYEQVERGLAAGRLPWEIDDEKDQPNTRVWAIGYFLNRAQHNIAANTDVATRAWARILGFDNREKSTPSLWYLLGELLNLVSDDVSRLAIEELRTAIAKPTLGGVPDKPEPLWEFLQNEAKKQGIHQSPYGAAYHALQTDARWVAVAYRSANFFKHRWGIRHPRKRLTYHMEWAVTARAHEWTGTYIWRLHADPNRRLLT